MAAACCTSLSSSMILRFSRATAAATGWPLPVKPWPRVPRLWLWSAMPWYSSSLIRMAEIGW
ncbi:hypothetical protein D3C81_2006200 [compost metagenome]